jgi:hypothetical protein
MKIALKTNVTGSTKRWGKIFAVFLIVGSLLGCIDAAIEFTAKGKLPQDMIFVLLYTITMIPIGLLWLIPPMFFGGYPAWIVSIFGERFLTELVQGLFEPRQNQRPRNPKKQRNMLEALLERRYGFAALIIFSALAGVLSSWL